MLDEIVGRMQTLGCIYFRITLLTFIVFSYSPNICIGQINEFKTISSGDWHVDSNWTLGIPTVEQEVLISSLSHVTVRGENEAICKSMVLYGELTIEEYSTLQVVNSEFAGISGWGSRMALHNYGSIMISNTNQGAIQLGTGKIYNYGLIEGKKSNYSGLYLFSGSYVENYGQIIFDDVCRGILLTRSSSYHNYGIFIVTNNNCVNSVGISTAQNSSVINYSSGEIYINSVIGSSSEGINNLAYFNNLGIISIDSVETTGIRNISLIENSGTISVSKTVGHSVEVIFDGIIQNTGDITIDSDSLAVSLGAINDNSRIVNDSCGLINITGKVRINENDSLVNSGTIHQYSPQLNEGMGVIYNEGVINDPMEANRDMQITNLGLYIRPLADEITVNEINFHTSFGTVEGYSILGNVLYKDSLLQRPAGYYDLGRFAFLPLPSAVGCEEFYGIISSELGCSDTITLSFGSVVAASNCEPYLDNYWVGPEIGTWFSDPANWSLGEFPNFCHNVILQGNTNLSVEEGHIAIAGTMEIDSGVIFSTSQGVLYISPD